MFITRFFDFYFEISAKKLAFREQDHPSYHCGTTDPTIKGNGVYLILAKVYILLLSHYSTVAAPSVSAKKIPPWHLNKTSNPRGGARNFPMGGCFFR